MIIQKVMQNKHTKQKTVTVPKDSGIEKGDYVSMKKVKGEQALAEKNLSAIARGKKILSPKEFGEKLNEEIRNDY